MENNRDSYPADQALRDAQDTSVHASHLLAQPVWLHLARGVVGAAAVGTVAMPTSVGFLALLAGVLVATLAVEAVARRVTGVEAGAEDAQLFWPANRRVVLVAAVLAVLAIGLLHGIRAPLPVRLLPALCYGAVWVLVAVHGDRARVQRARTGAMVPR